MTISLTQFSALLAANLIHFILQSDIYNLISTSAPPFPFLSLFPLSSWFSSARIRWTLQTSLSSHHIPTYLRTRVSRSISSVCTAIVVVKSGSLSFMFCFAFKYLARAHISSSRSPSLCCPVACGLLEIPQWQTKIFWTPVLKNTYRPFHSLLTTATSSLPPCGRAPKFS